MATNLEFITSVSGSGASSYSFTDFFSAKYDVYKLTLNNYVQGSTDKKAYLRFINSSGSEISSANYDTAFLVERAGGAFSEGRETNQTQMWHSLYNIVNNSDWGAGTMYIFNPFSSSSYTFIINQSFFRYNGVAGGTVGFEGYKQIGVLKTTDSITGIKYYNELSQNFDMEVSIYGVK